MFNISDGVLVAYKPNLHSRSITALVSFSPLKYLLTAAKDGTSELCVCVPLVFIIYGLLWATSAFY